MCQLLEPTQGQLMVTLMQRKLTYFGKYNLGFSWFGYVELAAYLLVWFNPTHSNRSVVPTLHLTKFLSWSKWPRYEWTESRSLSSISNDQGNKVKFVIFCSPYLLQGRHGRQAPDGHQLLGQLPRVLRRQFTVPGGRQINNSSLKIMLWANYGLFLFIFVLFLKQWQI